MTSFKGKTIKGKGLGAKIGYPTINIPYDGDLNGVFVGKVKFSEKWEKAAIHIGKSFTVDSVDSEKTVCESYLLDWSGNVELGIEIEIEIFEKIRDTEKFEDLDALKAQISKDVEFVKTWYTSHRNLV